MTKRNHELNNENYYIDANSASNIRKQSFISRDNSIVDLNQKNHQGLIYVNYPNTDPDQMETDISTGARDSRH